ncbi:MULTISPECIES: YggT family protein [Acinetobacter]|uniref:YggT family protein n=1 Tax=Acinetobacter TaxID=469 RepID=UPI001BCBE4F2|nr:MULTISPECIES: YggT family protein [Acinetobacter]MCO8071354.1 YggT family protein [Acinetobacter lwoffii]MCO8085466.1 YggT family protein [Acinetobacter lwoffii]
MGANSALIFGIIINVAILLVFFRFLMQLAAVSPYNPVVLSTVKATKIVDVFGRIFPTLAKGRVSTAALALLVVLYLLKIFGMMYLSGGTPNGPVHLIILTFVTMMQDLIRFCRYLIFATIILSWVVMFTQSRSPYIEVVQELAEPLLAPFRRIMPNMGMIDLSPIFAILTLIIIEMIMNQVAIVLLTGL